jgi:tetratricopeptide (TPR) repeat protein
MVLEAFSISHGKASAYLPVLDLLHTYFDIKPDDDSRARREKVAGKIAMHDRSLEDALPYLFGLLGIVDGSDPLAQMDGQIRRRRTLDAIKRILIRESLNQPLIVIFEDLHWIDSETQSFLNSMADSLANAKILLLVNYRPEYSHPWGSKTYYTQLRIDPLGMESADEMLAAILGDSVELVPLKRLVVEKTEGNPFFMEEAVQALFEDGALIRNGAVRLTRPLSQLRLPPTVHAILASRIDKLPPDQKELLQTVAVIGREFSFALLNEVVVKSEDELNRMLNDLQMSEFIYEQPAAGELDFIFKHALTQEVAANSMLLERRKLLHEQIGAAIESLYADRLDDHIDQLAHHYAQSTNTAKAVEFLHRAGQLAMRRPAYSLAAEHLTSALALLKTRPEGEQSEAEELRILNALSIVLHNTKGYAAPERAEVTARARELAEKKGDTKQLYLNFPGSWQVALGRGDYNAAQVIAERLLELAQSDEGRLLDPGAGNDNPAAHALTSGPALGLAHAINHVSCYYLGDLPGSERHFSRACELYKAKGVNLLTVAPGFFSYASWTAWRMGRIEVARTRMADAMAAADGNNDAEQKIVPPLMAAMERGMFTVKEREVLACKVIELCDKFEIPHMLAQGHIDLGRARAELGHQAEGVALIRQGIAEKEQTMSRLAHTHNYTVLAETQALPGEIDDALVTADKALELNPQERVDHPDAYRVRGDLRFKKGLTEHADQDFRKAIALSRTMSAKMLELSATTALCKLLRDTNRHDEARAMLSEIYNWFTEGFDTPDLKDAKVLLDELSA